MGFFSCGDGGDGNGKSSKREGRKGERYNKDKNKIQRKWNGDAVWKLNFIFDALG